MKLFYKFIIALISVSVIPLILFSVVALNTTGRALKKVINDNNLAMAENVTREVNKFFAEVDAKLDIARRIERAGGVSSSDRSRLLFSESLSSEILAGIYMLDRNFKVETGYEPGAEPGGGPGRMQMNQNLLVQAESSGQVEIGRIEYGPRNEPFFDIVYPLENPAREFFYIRVKLSYLTHRIRPYLSEEGDYQGRDVLLVDNFGTILSSISDRPSPLKEDSMKLWRSQEAGAVTVHDGNLSIASVGRGPGWLIVLSQPSLKAYGSIWKMQTVSLLLILLTVGLSVCLAFVLARNLSRPIETLISGIEVVANGNLDYQMPDVSTAELSKLARIFNTMTARLKQLQETMKKTERLSAVGEMASILGHEIRNPLSAIAGSAFLIRRQASKISGAEILLKPVGIIEKEIISTNKIIDDMLGYSRSRPPVLCEYEFGQVVRAIMEESKLPEDVKWEIVSSVPAKVRIDIEEIKQVVRNLVNNAVDAMAKSPGKTLKLAIAKAAISRNGKTVNAVSFEITDSGCGIPPEDIARIFEAFYSTKSKGTGLGLAVVRRIVEERHNGVIDVKSTVGVGTSMIIKLPLAG